MKCVCPMGGDRTCPDDCLHAAYWNLPEPDRKAQRKITAERYYSQNYTMEQIAQMLGVSHPTIVRDLREFVHDEQTPARTSKRGRKGEGRPKGKRQTKRRTGPTADIEQEMAEAVLDEGKTLEQVTREFGLPSVQHAKIAVAKEEARREPKADRADLSLSAQQKLDAALRQYKKALEKKFEQRVLEECKSRVDEMILPHWKKQIDQAKAIYDKRKSILKTKRDFNLILGCLHPDSRLSVSNNRLEEAFRLFNSLEKYLLDESQSPTDFGRPLPRTMAEWDQMRAAATAARRAKRHANPMRRQ